MIFLLGLLEDNWESLSDLKTSKKLIWDLIANELEESGFTLRGSNNHSYKPPYVNALTDQETSKTGKGEKQGTSKQTDEDSTSRISDDDIYCDSLDEKSSNDGKPRKNIRKPSKATKADKVLEVFKDMRNHSNQRHLEEKLERQNRHKERMEKSQQMMDVMKSLISIASKKKKKTRKSSKNKSPKKRRNSSPSRENIGSKKRSRSPSSSKESTSSRPN
ncbi:hypothetical protein OUZ56_010152 [Daphnia magna]|uniref:Uncharacterized protein n=1 Tax=Daphnia magna TaxID=35525 RepID=A0ABR0AHY3_9CRUS|nr:hypothetical protein OUZ56_010152 [Daphnia magna]